MARQTLTGLEILVVDKDERVRRGLDRLFRDMGLLATAVPDQERARDQLAKAQSAIWQRASGGGERAAEPQPPAETPEGAHHLGR